MQYRYGGSDNENQHVHRLRAMRLALVLFSVHWRSVCATSWAGWQVPGEIQQPKGPWQKPGEIQVPKGIQAVKREDAGCQHRLDVVADALFAFNKSDLNPDAEETLSALGPEITKLGNHPATIEGHTDSIGSADYNQRLSERRADAVKSGW